MLDKTQYQMFKAMFSSEKESAIYKIYCVYITLFFNYVLLPLYNLVRARAIDVPGGVIFLSMPFHRDVECVDFEIENPSLKCIGQKVFLYCENITVLHFPESVSYIADQAFKGCKNLSRVYCHHPDKLPFDRIFYGLEDLRIRKTGTKSLRNKDELEITEHTNAEGEKLTHINVPEGYMDIHVCVRDYPNISSTTLPDTLGTLNDYMFDNCNKLEVVNIPANIIHIPEGLFQFCPQFKSIFIPQGVKTIGEYAFKSCAPDDCVVIPNSVEHAGPFIFMHTVINRIVCSSKMIESTTYPNVSDWFNSNQIPEIITHQAYVDEMRSSLSINIISENTTQEERSLISMMEYLSPDELSVISMMRCYPDFEPSWNLILEIFKERSFSQVRTLMQKLNKKGDQLPCDIIYNVRTKEVVDNKEQLAIKLLDSLQTGLKEYLSLKDYSTLTIFGIFSKNHTVIPKQADSLKSSAVYQICDFRKS